MGEQLTEAQWAALNRALEMDTVGEVEYKSRQALMQLVGAFSEPISPAKVCYLDALGAEKEDSFLHYLQVLFCGALKVNALLFGCCDLGLFRQLQEAIHPVAQRVIVRIDHFIWAFSRWWISRAIMPIWWMRKTVRRSGWHITGRDR